MNTQNLKSTWWYRLLQVVYVSAFLAVAFLAFAVDSSNVPKSYIDPERSTIICTNGTSHVFDDAVSTAQIKDLCDNPPSAPVAVPKVGQTISAAQFNSLIKESSPSAKEFDPSQFGAIPVGGGSSMTPWVFAPGSDVPSAKDIDPGTGNKLDVKYDTQGSWLTYLEFLVGWIIVEAVVFCLIRGVFLYVATAKPIVGR